jgi:hypothetical protein
MQLMVTVDARQLAIHVPDDMLREAESFFAKMDRDMDGGWQMGPEFIETPDRVQRCQIAANKLLVSLSGANETMATLMAAYILSRLPGVTRVNIDTGGEMLNTSFDVDAPRPTPSSSVPAPPAGGDRRRAMTQAGQEVGAVYRAGRVWRFAVQEPNGQWSESPPFESEVQAQEARLKVVKDRYEAILKRPPRLN